MKNIICYGDSNTFGYNPKNGSKYDENTRWTAVLQKNSGLEYKIVNEGMPNRTGFVDNPEGVLFSAQKHLPQVLSKIKNIYLLILAIGTNDLQFQYNINSVAIEKGLENLIRAAKEKTTNIIVIAPIILSENILNGYFSSMFDKKSIEKSKEAAEIYKQTADKNHCIYFDINKYVVPSDFDGLHYDENSHKIIADKLYELIRKI